MRHSGIRWEPRTKQYGGLYSQLFASVTGCLAIPDWTGRMSSCNAFLMLSHIEIFPYLVKECSSRKQETWLRSPVLLCTSLSRPPCLTGMFLTDQNIKTCCSNPSQHTTEWNSCGLCFLISVMYVSVWFVWSNLDSWEISEVQVRTHSAGWANQ